MYIIKNYKVSQQTLVGSKAKNLFILAKYFNVPEFVVISSQGFKDYRLHRKFSVELYNELKNVLRNFFKMGPIVVRSSGVAEDLPGISFAGLYNTTLNITDFEKARAAIIRTWDSADTARVKSYCQKMNISLGDMAVIIQHQLEPEISGVMVTRSPFAGNEIMIECCRGLGEKLVAGKIIPTRYRIRGGEIVEQKGENLLSPGQIGQLVKAGKKIEKIFKSPQDIEWSFANGNLYLLQSRSILLHAAVPRRKCTVWTNANLRETLPTPVSPLAWSYLDEIILPTILIKCFRIPVSIDQYFKIHPVELLAGRAYWNLNNTMAYGKTVSILIDLLKVANLDPQIATASKAIDIKHLPELIPAGKMIYFSLKATLRLTYYLGLGFFRYQWMLNKIKKSQEEILSHIRHLKLSEELKSGMAIARGWAEHFINNTGRSYFGGIFLSMFHLIILGKLLSLQAGKKGTATARHTIFGIIDKTGEMVLTLNSLARLANSRLNKNKITSNDLRKLRKSDSEFSRAFNDFIYEFGHRGPGEFDMANLTWREDLDMLYQLILTAINNKNNAIDRTRIITNLLQTSSPYGRFMIKLFLPRIEAHSPLRENAKHVYFLLQARIKDQLAVIEKKLIKNGYLKKNRDIFFLTLGELDNIVNNRSTKSDIMNIVKTRKQEWQVNAKLEPPEIIYESGELITAPVVLAKSLSGEPLSYGKIRARARVIKDFNHSKRLKQGEILVTHHTDPAWTPLFTVAAGLIVEVGGVVCHGAMVARELGLPAVMLKRATSLIKDGVMVELDANLGKVSLL